MFNWISQKSVYVKCLAALSFASLFMYIFSTFGSFAFQKNVYEIYSKFLCGTGSPALSKVESTNPNDNFNSFFTLADDKAGKEAKATNETFLLSQKEDDFIPMKISLNEISYDFSSVCSYTSWQFEKYNYGLTSYFDIPLKNLERFQIMVSYSCACEIADKYSVLVEDLLDMKFRLDASSDLVEIVNVFNDSNKPIFKNLIGNSFCVVNFNKFPKRVHNTYYCLFGSHYIGTTYQLTFIENSVKQLNSVMSTKYSITYLDYSKEGFTIGKNQLVREKTESFYLTKAKYLGFSFVFFALAINLLLFTYCYKSKYNLSNCFIAGSSIGGALSGLLFVLKGFLINNVYFCFINISTPFMILGFFLLSIFEFVVLFRISKRKKVPLGMKVEIKI